jgi:hypothetical protein
VAVASMRGVFIWPVTAQVPAAGLYNLTWLTIRGFRRGQGCDLWFRWFRCSVLRTSPGF